MNNKAYLILSIYLNLISCNCHVNKFTEVTTTDTSQRAVGLFGYGDTLKNEKVFPFLENSSLYGRRQQLLQDLANTISLPSLNKGNKGLKIRIWLPADSTNYIINIYNNLDKECSIIEWGSKNVAGSEYIIIKNEWKNLVPNLGWEVFFDTLIKYRIYSMKSGKSFRKQTEYLTRMDYIQFEIAKGNHYRFYEYLEPSFYRYVDTGSMNIFSFLEYFNQVMNVQVYTPEKKLFAKPQ